MPAEYREIEPFRGNEDMTSQDDGVVVPLSAARQGTNAGSNGENMNDTQFGSRRPDWAPSPKAVMTATKWLTGLMTAAWFIGWPVGTTISHVVSTGTFAIRFGYSPEVFLLALTSAALVFGAGFAIAAGFRLEAAAQRLTKSFGGFAGDFSFPQSEAARQQIGALNSEIDAALARLAEAESLIRQQVRAINSAGSAIEAGAVKSTDRLEKERQALMELTEEMNREAESFADKIAERTKFTADEQGQMEERLLGHERELDSQLQRLEAVSAKSLDKFEQLASTMEGRSDTLKSSSEEATERQSAIASQLEENTKRIETAQAELAEQSERLENLIQDQRKRAEKLAKAVTDQAAKAVPLPAPDTAQTEVGQNRKNVAWKDILATAEEAMPAEEEAAPAAPSVPDMMDRLVNRLHNFSLVMRTQLYDGPSHEELDRFEQGERQIFSRDLVSRDAMELKRRVADEIARNEVFKERVDEFLRDFDTLLEPLSTEEGGEAAIESYLASPIGRLYILTGSAVDHFA